MRTNAGDVSADRCSQRQEERDCPEPVFFRRQVKISVEKPVCAFTVTAMHHVHQQERQIVEHIDRREVLRKFKAVKQCGTTIEQADIAKVQVAVTAAYPSSIAATIKQRTKPV